MGERTKLGLGIVGVALVLGLLGDVLHRAAPWGLNVFLFALPLVGLAASLAAWRGVSLLVAPLLLFAALYVRRDSDTLAVTNGLSLLVALSLAVLRSRSGGLVAGLPAVAGAQVRESRRDG